MEKRSLVLGVFLFVVSGCSWTEHLPGSRPAVTRSSNQALLQAWYQAVTVMAYTSTGFRDLRVNKLPSDDDRVKSTSWYWLASQCWQDGTAGVVPLQLSSRRRPGRFVVLGLLSLRSEYTRTGELTGVREHLVFGRVLDCLERAIWVAQQEYRRVGLQRGVASLLEEEAFRDRVREAEFRAWASPDEFLFVVHDVVGQAPGVFAVDCVSRFPRPYWGIKGPGSGTLPLVVSVLVRSSDSAVDCVLGVDDYFLPSGVWLRSRLDPPE